MDQLDFPFYLDEPKLKEFLTRYIAIEDEEDRLREDKRLLRDEYADEFPMRGVLTAVKVVRARRKLEAHTKEPMSLAHQTHLEAMVDAHLLAMGEEARAVPDMTGARG